MLRKVNLSMNSVQQFFMGPSSSCSAVGWGNVSAPLLQPLCCLCRCLGGHGINCMHSLLQLHPDGLQPSSGSSRYNTTQLRGTSWGTQCLLQWVAKLMVALLQLCSKHSANCAARHVTHHHPGESTSTSRCAAHSGQQGEQCIFVPFSFSHCAPARDDSKR